jgi:sulfate adenylyltransferase
MSGGWVLPDDVLAGAPSFTPRAAELADLELLLIDALAPLGSLPTRADLNAITQHGRLADGTPWPVPLTLEAPTSLLESIDLENPLRRAVIVADGEGAPVAAVDVVDAWQTRDGMSGIGGPIRRIGEPTRGEFKALRRTPEEVRKQLPPGRIVGVVADRPLHRPQLAQIVHATRTLQAHLLLMIPVAEPAGDGLPPEALVRCVLAARHGIPPASPVVGAPRRPRRHEIRDALIRARVAQAYGVTHLLAAGPGLSGGGPRVLVPRELAYDGRDGQWRGRDDIPLHNQRAPLADEELDDLLDRGFPLPEWHTPPAVAKELARARPARRHRGIVVFFTGLSGSGKSTIARGVASALRETGERTVTILDGDVVRRELSAGLTFSRADRDRNIRRVGWVAAEIARHRGMAVCCPIAPYARARADARAMAHAAGAGFVLVWVSTPLEVCEQRDRKGLYAKARAGEVTGMTGVDDPYEEPEDADLELDTTTMSVEEAIARVLTYLDEHGWVELSRTT